MCDAEAGVTGRADGRRRVLLVAVAIGINTLAYSIIYGCCLGFT